MYIERGEVWRLLAGAMVIALFVVLRAVLH